MSAAEARLEGGCLCGGVRFSARPEKREIGVCHCSMCRKWGGGPWFAVDCGSSVEVTSPELLGAYRSSEWAERCYCTACGTALFYKLVNHDHWIVSAEAFDDLEGFAFTQEIFIDEKPAYYTFANQTRKMTGAEVFAEYAASQGTGDG